MIKYCMSGTDEELHYGDTIEVTLSKKEKGNVIYKVINCTFTPEAIPYLLDMEIIEKKKVKEDVRSSILDFVNTTTKDSKVMQFMKITSTIDSIIGALQSLNKEINSYISSADGKKEEKGK